MLALGVTDPAEARRLVARPGSELARLDAAARLGVTIRSVLGASADVVRLVDSLRAYLRGDDAAGPLVPDVDVATGIQHAVRLVADRLDRVTVRWELDQVPTVVARPGALQQVWTNLLANALDAMDDRGELTLRVTTGDPTRVRVEVVDDGPGFGGVDPERLFEPRFTHDHGRVRYGMGLGLSISRRIVHEHDGSIHAERRGDRTVFVVELPVAGPARDPARGDPAPGGT